MNCLTLSFATSSRFCGWKSSDSIELERSIAMTMLIPSLLTFSVCAPERGRASATISPASSEDAERAEQSPRERAAATPAREHVRAREHDRGRAPLAPPRATRSG